ncbi:MAG: DUF4340 domain-containing protein [Treponema sp.]|jgi:hypothetical protein|nr:DUF4340 domain-containing protein [Treponema sp.]
MTYKNKITALLVLIAGLALAFAAGLVFNPERSGSRSSSYAWLDSKAVSKITRITFSGQTELELKKTNGLWFVSKEGNDYPARGVRVEDFLGVLSARAPYPVVSTGASSHKRLGLDGESASRVSVFADNASVLDLLLGGLDSSGRGIYLRKYGQNEARSGDDKFSLYVTGSVTSWYNLKLFPETEDGKLDAEGVQRFIVYTPGGRQDFGRVNKEWAISGIEVANPDKAAVDAYIRTILNTEGDDFASPDQVSALDFNNSRIDLELGSGGVKTVRLTEADEQNRRYAQVSGSDYVYSIAGWMAQRLFKTAQDFEKKS